jgi:hypothetical protein
MACGPLTIQWKTDETYFFIIVVKVRLDKTWIAPVTITVEFLTIFIPKIYDWQCRVWIDEAILLHHHQMKCDIQYPGNGTNPPQGDTTACVYRAEAAV